MNEIKKNSGILIVLGLLVVTWVVVSSFDFSLLDLVADRVIERLDANYSPYGPNYQPSQPMN